MRKKVTLKDATNLAQVSPTTVSFALNGTDKLPDDTVRKVRTAAKQLGYIRDPAARTLRDGKTRSLGVLLPQTLSDVMKNP